MCGLSLPTDNPCLRAAEGVRRTLTFTESRKLSAVFQAALVSWSSSLRGMVSRWPELGELCMMVLSARFAMSTSIVLSVASAFSTSCLAAFRGASSGFLWSSADRVPPQQLPRKCCRNSKMMLPSRWQAS